MRAEKLTEQEDDTQSGTYLLVLACTSSQVIEIGKLGKQRLKRGYYMYVGSAFGPGGVRARLRHHCVKSNRPRWHIDYLRQVLEVRQVWYSCDASPREQDWVKLLEHTEGVTAPIEGFGASDSRRRSHLFYQVYKPKIDNFRHTLLQHYPTHEKLHECVCSHFFN